MKRELDELSVVALKELGQSWAGIKLDDEDMERFVKQRLIDATIAAQKSHEEFTGYDPELKDVEAAVAFDKIYKKIHRRMLVAIYVSNGITNTTASNLVAEYFMPED